MYPPVARTPLLQTYSYPFAKPAIPSRLVAPDCSVNTWAVEGELIAVESNISLLCRAIPDMGTINQTFSVVQSTFNPNVERWEVQQSLTTRPLAINIGSAGLNFVESSSGELWSISQTQNSGNGAITSLWYTPITFGTPTQSIVLQDSSRGTTFLDLQLTSQGLYGLVRRSPIPSAGGTTGLVETGLVFWPMSQIPRRPFDAVSLLPGTNSSRIISSFFVPDTIGIAVALYQTPALSPFIIEEWRLELSQNSWIRTSTIPIRSHTTPIVKLIGSPSELIAVSQKTLSVVSFGAGGWIETLLTQLEQTSPLQFRSIAFGKLLTQATPTATPSPSPTQTASQPGTPTASVSSSPSETPTPTQSITLMLSSTNTPTSSESPSGTSSPTSTMTPTSSSTPSASTTSTQGTSPSGTPSPTVSPTSSASTTSTQGTSPTGTSSATPSLTVSPTQLPIPVKTSTQSSQQTSSITPSLTPTILPPLAPQANTLTAGERAGIGIGVTSAILLAGGIGIGLFARQIASSVIQGFKQLYKPKPPTQLQYFRPKAPVDHVVQVSVNPAHMMNRTDFDLLQLARQHRLEAIQLQKEQTLSQTANPDRKSIKKVQKPVLGPETFGTSV